MLARVVTIRVKPEKMEECISIFGEVNAPSVAAGRASTAGAGGWTAPAGGQPPSPCGRTGKTSGRAGRTYPARSRGCRTCWHRRRSTKRPSRWYTSSIPSSAPSKQALLNRPPSCRAQGLIYQGPRPSNGACGGVNVPLLVTTGAYPHKQPAPPRMPLWGLLSAFGGRVAYLFRPLGGRLATS